MAVETLRETKVDALRAELPAVQMHGYFNAGTYGPMPRVAAEAAEAALRRKYEQGRIAPGDSDIARLRNRRVAALAANLFGADEDEIALTHSASEGLNTALLGIAWAAGDEVVTTRQEHSGLLLPLSLLAHRHGVVTRYADIGNGGSHVVAAIAAQITSRTRVIALSHLLWSTGAILPLREICELAREHELMVIVDGAQSAGQISVNLHELGVDAYAMPGQKWLCGPEATGLLYVRRDRFTDIQPSSVRYGEFEPSGYFMPAPGAKRYENGEFSGVLIAAQEAALHWLRDDVGLEWAYARISALGDGLHRRLTDIEGVTLLTPPVRKAGMINFMIAGMRPQDVSAALFERGYIIRYVDTQPCSVSARVSVGWWNTEEEVAGLGDAIAGLAAEAAHAAE